MRLSTKYRVPPKLALLYEFVNSVDLRHFVEQGTAHTASDELASIPEMENWMRTRRLLEPGAQITKAQHRTGLELRESLRAFLAVAPEERGLERGLKLRLSKVGEHYPLVVTVEGDAVTLQPAPGSSGLARILAELHGLSEAGGLRRMKVCASGECNWIFYDRSRPGTRRWCSSALCGNRQKTRAYRQRRKEAGARP